MSDAHGFFQDTTTTREDILESTYYALCTHGYADLTIAKIGNHFEKSQSLIYHHYQDKDKLLLDLLEYMLAELESQVPLLRQSPGAYMDEIVAGIFGDTDESSLQFSKAVFELRAQTAHNEEYRELFNRSDEFLRTQITQVIRAGNEKDLFDVEHPKQSAALFQTVIIGIQGQQTTNPDVVGMTKAEFQRYIDRCILNTK